MRSGAVSRKALIEALCVLAVSLAAGVEALRLIIYKDPYKMYDPIGPGLYLVALSAGLFTVAAWHFAAGYRKGRAVTHKVRKEGEMRQLLSTIVVLLLYILLLDITGYLVATVIFFLLDMRVSGVKSWRTNVVLTLFLAAVCYFIFVRVCELPFPRGIFFGS